MRCPALAGVPLNPCLSTTERWCSRREYEHGHIVPDLRGVPQQVGPHPLRQQGRLGVGELGQPLDEGIEGTVGVPRLPHPVEARNSRSPGRSRTVTPLGGPASDSPRPSGVHASTAVSVTRPSRSSTGAGCPHATIRTASASAVNSSSTAVANNSACADRAESTTSRRSSRAATASRSGRSRTASRNAPEQRGHRRDGRQPVPLHIAHDRPHPVGPSRTSKKSPPDQRPALRRPVQPRAPHRPHPLRQRRHDGPLRGLGDRALGHSWASRRLRTNGHEHAEQPRRSRRSAHPWCPDRSVGRPGRSARPARAAEHRGRGRAVRQHGQRRDGAQQEPDVERIAGSRGSPRTPRPAAGGQHPHPERRRRAPQPASAGPGRGATTGRALRSHPYAATTRAVTARRAATGRALERRERQPDPRRRRVLDVRGEVGDVVEGEAVRLAVRGGRVDGLRVVVGERRCR